MHVFKKCKTTIMIAIKSLSYTYDGSRIFRYPDFYCDDGKELLITGRSGCGKTTLLHIIAGLLTGFDGAVLINNIALSKMRSSALDRFRRSHIGIVFQAPHMIQSLTVRDNIAAAALDKRLPDLEMLTTVLGVGHLLRRMPASLSQGEKQRISIVRALINRPGVLLADEPTSSLDDQNSSSVIDLLKNLCSKTKCSLVIVTHDSRVKEKIPNTVQLS